MLALKAVLHPASTAVPSSQFDGGGGGGGAAASPGSPRAPAIAAVMDGALREGHHALALAVTNLKPLPGNDSALQQVRACQCARVVVVCVCVCARTREYLDLYDRG